MPRELRDHVYRALIRSLPTPFCNVPSSNAVGPEFAKDHWLNAEFVGPDFARESAEIYYEEITFSFVHTMDIRKIHGLLGEDMFGYGIVPADHIRACEFQLLAKDAQDMRYSIEFGLAETPDYTVQFEALLALKASVTVSIVVNMSEYGEFTRRKVLIYYLDLLKSHLYRYRVKVASSTFTWRLVQMYP